MCSYLTVSLAAALYNGSMRQSLIDDFLAAAKLSRKGV